jgi:hypothetical protein
MRSFNRIIWSPVEEEWLKEHRDLPVDQQCIQLSKSKNAIRVKLREIDGKPVKSSQRKTVSRIGKRKDLGIAVRSGWEANILRYLKFVQSIWEYEPRVFFFHEIKHGTTSYTPDIYLPEQDIWVEVKGYLKPSDKTRIRRFKKYYPEEFAKLHAVVQRKNTAADKFFASLNIPIFYYYADLEKEWKDVIPAWE